MTALLARPHVAIERAQLPNGLHLVVAPEPGLGFAVVDTWHATGAMDDGAGRSGLAHLAEHVCFGEGPRGTGAAGSAQVSERNATTSFERTNFVDVGPPGAVPAMLEQVAARIPRATGGDAVLDAHLAVVRQEIGQRENAAYFGSGLRRSLRLLFGPQHPFGRPALGDPAELGSLTADDVAEHVRRGYGAADTVVAVVGDLGELGVAGVFDRAVRALATVPAGRPVRRRVLAAAPPSAAREDVEEGQATAMLRLSFLLPPDLAGSPDTAGTAAAEVLLAGLAGAPWTIFGTEFAAAHGVLAAAGDVVTCRWGPSVGVLRFALPAGGDPDVLELVVRDRLARVADTGLGDDVHAAASARTHKQRLARLSSARMRAELLCQHQSWHGDADLINRVPPDVDPADVAAGARLAADPAVVAFRSATHEEPSWIL